MKSHGEIRSDDQGRLVLPSVFGKEFGLVPGTTLVVERASEDGIMLRIEDGEQKLVDRGGILVFEPDEVDEAAISGAIESARAARVSELLDFDK
jgi:bifunctional DNA-binding transcriptional regulator/antitoxin component of YhaV-PrlF toxin-antitoxin module